MNHNYVIFDCMKGLIIFFSLLLACADSCVSAQESLNTPVAVEITGNLAIEKDAILFHTTTGSTFQLTGPLSQQLKQIAELGETNRLVLKGIRENKRMLRCRTTYDFSEKGEYVADAVCIVVYGFEPAEIIKTWTSDEPLPPPERDTGHEKFVREIGLDNFRQQLRPSPQETRGTIISTNVQKTKAVNFVKVKIKNKAGVMLKETFILNPNIRVSRSDITQQEVLVTKNALRPGQEIVIGFWRDERKPRASQNEAYSITIVKDIITNRE